MPGRQNLDRVSGRKLTAPERPGTDYAESANRKDTIERQKEWSRPAALDR